MRYFKQVILSLFLFGYLVSGNAQDVSFSQTYASPLYLSPSFAGFSDGSRLVFNYRDQWPGIPGTYRSLAFSADHYFGDYNSGVGLLFLRDDQGSGKLVKQNLGLSYSYEIEVLRNIFVRPGIQFKFAQQKIDPSRLTPRENISPDDGTSFPGYTYAGTESYNWFDATASAMVYGSNFWVGVVVDHLVKRDVAYTYIETFTPMKTTIYGGYKILYNENSRSRDDQSITFASNIRLQDKFNQMDLGLYWYFRPMELGLWYRGIPVSKTYGLSTNDAIIMILGVTFGNLRFSYSYDFTMSDLAGSTGGANEFSIMFNFNNSGAKSKTRKGAIPYTNSRYSGSTRKSYHRRRLHKIF
jgi:type IX secretion system PorP/SprF family membrane protein